VRRVRGRPFGIVVCQLGFGYGLGDRGRTYVVDEDVDFTQLFNRRCHSCVDGFVVAHVGCTVDDFTVRMTGSLELLLQSAEFVLATGQRGTAIDRSIHSFSLASTYFGS